MMKYTPLVLRLMTPISRAIRPDPQMAGGTLQIAVVDLIEGEDRHGVSADAEIGSVAKTHQAAKPEDEIQTDRGDGEDHDACKQRGVKRRLQALRE